MSEQQKSLKQIIDFRLEKLEKLKKAGINPYPSKFEPSHQNRIILSNYESYENNLVYCGFQ